MHLMDCSHPVMEIHSPVIEKTSSQGRFYSWRHHFEPIQNSSSHPVSNPFACYYDVSGMGSSIWNFIHWIQPSPDQGYESFSTAEFTSYLKSLYTQLNSVGIDQINLSFSQICDLDALAAGDLSSLSVHDSLGILLEQMISDHVHFPAGVDILNLITSTAKDMNMGVSLSYGGENAIPTDFALCGPNENPNAQAQKLIDFMQAYHISAVDFDVEGINASAFADDKQAFDFFSSLQRAGIVVSLTIQGSLTQTVWGSSLDRHNPSTFNGPLKALFYDHLNQPIFATLFTGLNLMLYDNGSKYYLDAKAYPDDITIPDWCIEDWLSIIGADHAGLLHLGFQDATPYASETASASGHTYYEPDDPTDPLAVHLTDSAGSAGAKIFLQLQRQLKEDGYSVPLGQPFFWPNYNSSRYQPTHAETAQFLSPCMRDFYHTLHSLGT